MIEGHKTVGVNEEDGREGRGGDGRTHRLASVIGDQINQRQEFPSWFQTVPKAKLQAFISQIVRRNLESPGIYLVAVEFFSG
ncbi:hypothetical protein RRG08_013986 [Elysia crispata]|uniref:Uncharacterized protein n=1 Tax=Elysia crispata TaxID=231223 RepID=A0AAE1CVV9_9GAST|nr:hypothetical protein RRG08_013986 [Elysia crispata]